VLGISYLTKEPGAFVALAVLVYALARQRWRLALSLACGVAFVAAGELAWYWSQSGDLLFRLHAMAAHNGSDMAVAANENLAYRLWKTYPRMMLVPAVDFGLHSLLVVGLAGVALLWQRNVKTLFLLLWAVVPFLYLNFGSSSLQFYWALPSAPRYISLVYAPLFVLAASQLLLWADTMHKRIVVAGLVGAVCVVGVASAARTRQIGYNTQDVKQLKSIAAAARQNQARICQCSGPEGTRWQRALAIIAPDRLGCAGPSVLQVVPDSRACQ
jgi:hypothetical protein